MRATAAVFEKLFTPLSVTEVEIDEPRPGEVLVKIVATGVCHTDALARDGDMPFPARGVLGQKGRRSSDRAQSRIVVAEGCLIDRQFRTIKHPVELVSRCREW